MKNLSVLNVLLFSLIAWSCADLANTEDEINDEFSSVIDQLESNYGSPEKADFFGILDPCDILTPLQEWSDQLLHSGFFIGVQGESLLGAGTGFGGMDIVWDFYHSQITVSAYKGLGISLSPGVNVSGGVYTGWVTGFKHGVSDWDGKHYQVSGEVSLPFIREYVHLKPEVFVIPKESDPHYANYENNELEGNLFGFSIGISLGLELFPEPSPITVSVSQGEWTPNDQAISNLYHKLKSKRIFPVVGEPLAIRLVDHHTGITCSEQWPAIDYDKDCVIQLGDSSWSHTRNALHFATSVCSLTNDCVSPLSWPVSMLSIALGSWRDHMAHNYKEESICESK